MFAAPTVESRRDRQLGAVEQPNVVILLFRGVGLDVDHARPWSPLHTDIHGTEDCEGSLNLVWCPDLGLPVAAHVARTPALSQRLLAVVFSSVVLGEQRAECDWQPK